MQLIKDRQIIEDTWRLISDSEPLPGAGDVMVSLSRFNNEQAQLKQFQGRLGLRLHSSDEPENISGDLQLLTVIAVEFPKFTDGRGFTTARLLRERFGFKGELRAVGHPLRDQLFYMWRCGFNAFEVPAGKDIKDALSAFDDFSVTYQAAADDPRPLYRRRSL